MENAVFRAENTGLLGDKHPYFLGKTSELYLEEVRCFPCSEGKTPKNRSRKEDNAPATRDAKYSDEPRCGGFRWPSQGVKRAKNLKICCHFASLPSGA